LRTPDASSRPTHDQRALGANSGGRAYALDRLPGDHARNRTIGARRTGVRESVSRRRAEPAATPNTALWRASGRWHAETKTLPLPVFLRAAAATRTPDLLNGVGRPARTPNKKPTNPRFCGAFEAAEGTRTLDLLHGKRSGGGHVQRWREMSLRDGAYFYGCLGGVGTRSGTARNRFDILMRPGKGLCRLEVQCRSSPPSTCSRRSNVPAVPST
jgi:hypothetical protein